MSLPYYTIGDASSIHRRSFLKTTASLSVAAMWASRSSGAIRRDAKFSDYPFSLGVASGDPSPDGFALWTRLAPKPLEGGGMNDEPVEVDWQVAEDEGMTRVVRKGSIAAKSDWAHSVHVEVEGLEPDRWYWYQFRAGGEASPKGRTRTMPAAAAMPSELKMAFASCQHFESGYYTAYQHMLAESPDLVIHLGDYIYEGGPSKGQPRTHVDGKLDTLAEYRNRHAQYKTDADLQAMHAAAPWLVTWDDHEVENNYADGISERKNVSVKKFLAQRARAYKAYYEHMPLRRRSLPNGPAMPLYRRVAFGRLAEFNVLDTRQYRTDQPCGDGTRPPCEDANDPKATILGEAQRTWLLDGLTQSQAKWNVLAQQVMMARVDQAGGKAEAYSADQWPGYEVDRRRVLKHFHERKIANPVVLTGDIHTSWANELIADFDDLDSAVVAAELVGGSISSGGDGAIKPRWHDHVTAENPFVKFHNAERCYVICRISPDRWQTDFRMVEYVKKKGSPIHTRASFVLNDGDSRLHRA